MPGAVSSDNSYYLWKRPENLETVIGVGISPKWLEQIFEGVEVAQVVELENVNPWDREFRVTICRKPKLTVEELWPQLRPW